MHAESKDRYVELVKVELVLLLAHELLGLLSLLLVFNLPLQVFKVLLLVGYLTTLVEHAAESAICEFFRVHSLFFSLDLIFNTDLLVEDFTHLLI